MICTILVMILLMIYPNESIVGATEGLELCANSVIPALFPFFVLTKILTSKLPIRFLSPILISFLGGYPNGICTVTAMYENGSITKHDAEQAILYCNNSGPGFFIGMIGSIVFKSVKMGLILFAIHVASALLCAAFLQRRETTYQVRKIAKPQTFAQIFSNSISTSCTAMLQVCGIITFFSVLISVIFATNLLNSIPLEIKTILSALLELTSGISKLGNSKNDFIICAFLMGWGGLCVHMQAMSFWQKSGLKPHGYFRAKLLHAVISAFIAFAFQYPSRISFGILIVMTIIFIFFPLFRQKWGRKTKKIVV